MATDTTPTTIQAAYTARTASVGFVLATTKLPTVTVPAGIPVTVRSRLMLAST